MKTSILFACILSLTAGAAAAQEFKVGSLEIDHPWSRATPKGAKVAVGYLTIKNTGTDRGPAGERDFARRRQIGDP